jgi:hypothetical protein
MDSDFADQWGALGLNGDELGDFFILFASQRIVKLVEYFISHDE